MSEPQVKKPSKAVRFLGVLLMLCLLGLVMRACGYEDPKPSKTAPATPEPKREPKPGADKRVEFAAGLEKIFRKNGVHVHVTTGDPPDNTILQVETGSEECNDALLKQFRRTIGDATLHGVGFTMVSCSDAGGGHESQILW